MADYSELSMDVATNLLLSYGMELVEITPLRGGAANSSFLAHTLSSSVVITVLDNHTEGSARELVGLIDHLEGSGVAVDGVLRDLEGVAIAFSTGNTPTIVRRFVEGRHPQGAPPDVEKIGRTIAQIHLTRPLDALPFNRREVPRDWREALAGTAPPDLEEVLKTALSFTGSESWAKLRRYLSHGDLFPDNLLIDSRSGDLVVLDWETASVDPCVVDIGIAAIALHDLCSGGVDAALDQLVAAYEQVRLLDALEREQLRNGLYVGGAVLAFHRFKRHNITHPNPEKASYYRELTDLLRLNEDS